MTTRPDAVDEAPFWVEVNGWRVGAATCTPERLEALAAGWLLAHGFIERAEDMAWLEPVAAAEGSFGLRVSVDPGRAQEATRHIERCRESGAGPLYFVHHAPHLLRGRARLLPLPSPDRLAELFRALWPAEREPGSVHAAAVTDGAELRHRVEDVSRGSAVDKAIGAALLAGQDLARLGLLVSGRVSGGIALRAARCGVAWVASDSIPTTLALRVAAAAALPIVARATREDARVHWPPASEPAP
ncbi:MAG TPA: formate dehydrogenase accessory sulfurtransferase FdhD [Longimicrobiales bacterium]